jgi:hypothetical protein
MRMTDAHPSLADVAQVAALFAERSLLMRGQERSRSSAYPVRMSATITRTVGCGR